MRRFTTWIVVGIVMCSCTTRQVTPSRASRKAIDSIFQQQVNLSLHSMDSICRLYHDSIYSVALDSILAKRREEMIELVK